MCSYFNYFTKYSHRYDFLNEFLITKWEPNAIWIRFVCDWDLLSVLKNEDQPTHDLSSSIFINFYNIRVRCDFYYLQHFFFFIFFLYSLRNSPRNSHIYYIFILWSKTREWDWNFSIFYFFFFFIFSGCVFFCPKVMCA